MILISLIFLIVFVCSIGVVFYRLAGRYKKPKWPYALLAIFVWFIINITFDLLYRVVRYEVIVAPPGVITKWAQYFSPVMGFVVGVLYALLKRHWSRTEKKTSALDSDFVN